MREDLEQITMRTALRAILELEAGVRQPSQRSCCELWRGGEVQDGRKLPGNGEL